MTGDILHLLAHPGTFEALTGLPRTRSWRWSTPSGRRWRQPSRRGGTDRAAGEPPGRGGRTPSGWRRLEARVLAAVSVGRFGRAATGPVGIFLGVHWDTVRRAARVLVPLLAAAGAGSVCAPLSSGERRTRLSAACRGLPDHGGRLRALAFRYGFLPAADGSVVLPAASAGAA